MKRKIGFKGSIIPAAILVIIILLYLPWIALEKPIVLLGVILVVLFMAATKIKGASLVVITIGLCIPVLIGVDDLTKELFANNFKWLIRTQYLCSLCLCLYYILQKEKDKTKKDLPLRAIILISVAALLNGILYDEIISWAFKILTVPVMFYVGYQGRESWSDLVRIMNIFFVIVSAYAILDMFFNIGPYVNLKDSLPIFDTLFRAGGLFVNSLCMTGFLLCYHAFLLINYHRTGHLSPWLIVASLFTLLLTGSRTAFVVVAILWLLFVFYLSKGQKEKVRVVVIMFAMGITLFVVLWINFQDYLILYFDRFSESSDHRTSGFQTTINIMSAHPFGVGYTGLEDAFSKYSSAGFILELNTLDNMYLTFMATSGLFFLIPLLFYLFIPFNAFYRSRQYRGYRSVVMLFIPYVLCGLTFNIEAFMQLNLVYFALAGHMYRIIQTEQNNGFINNNC